MMDIAIYQIDPDLDSLGVLFSDLRHAREKLGSEEIEASVYGKAFEGEVDAEDLEEVFEFFNLDKPEGFRGRSMSVSDVVAVRDPEGGGTEYFFCDSVGFRKIGFDEERAAKEYREKIRVVFCGPGEKARIKEIGTGLEDLQREVRGTIEAYYPFEEDVCVVCNDEGKLNGMRPNRAVYDREGNITDIIFGPFFVCGIKGPEFASLTGEQAERYGKMFQDPEYFLKIDGRIRAIPYPPADKMERSR